MAKTLENKIIEISEEILDILLNYKKQNPDFTFSLRQRDSPQSKDKRLEKGFWFQGSDYIYVPLFKKGDNARKIKTIGFVIGFNKDDVNIINNYIEISFKTGSNEIEEAFHKELAAFINLKLNKENFGSYFFSDSNYAKNLQFYLGDFRNKAIELLDKYSLKKQFIIPEDQFNKSLNKINETKDKLAKTSQKINDKNQLIVQDKTMKIPLNQILYGPPGTGKTYTTILKAAKIISDDNHMDYNLAKEVFKNNLGDQIEFITFHQNYSYEDFIQGLRPDTENGKELSFEKKDGVFKRIADRALANLKASKDPTTQKRSFESVFNELIAPLNNEDINEMEIKMKKTSFFITEVGEKSIAFRKNNGGSDHTLSIATLKRMYEKDENDIIIGGLQPYYNPILKLLLEKGKNNLSPIELKNYVIVIDEINRANISRVFGELITLIEDDKRSEGAIPLSVTLPSGDPFIVPSNLYIIGTMNTADKSIALLDIALRRRFEFEPLYPDYTISGLNDQEVLEAINNEIINRKGYDFTIGHAYFMGDNYNQEKTINTKVIPLLLEYFMNEETEVKAILKAANIEIVGWPLKMKI